MEMHYHPKPCWLWYEPLLLYNHKHACTDTQHLSFTFLLHPLYLLAR